MQQNQSSTTDYPRRNFVLVTENTLTPYDRLNLHYSHAVSNYVPDDMRNKRLIDYNWKFGADFMQDLYSFRANLEHVGNQYASVGIPSTYRNFEGFDFSSGFKFAKNLSANLGGRLTRNNVERNPRLQTTYTRSLNTSASLGLPWQQNVSMAWSINETILNGGDQDMSGTTYNDYRVDYSKAWGNMTATVSLDHYVLNQFAAATGGSVTDSISYSLFDFYPTLNNSYLRLYQSYRKIKSLTANSYTTEYFDTDLNGRLNLTDY